MKDFRISVESSDGYIALLWTTEVDNNEYHSAFLKKQEHMETVLRYLYDNEFKVTTTDVNALGYSVEPDEKYWESRLVK